MRITVDTNVIVSGLINTNGIPAKVLTLVLNGNHKLLYDNRIIFEYSEVLSRKEFGFSPETINNIIDFFRFDGKFINAPYIKLNFSDETDKKFYEVYKYGKADYLITGNLKHFPRERGIVTPKMFIEKEMES